MLAKRILLHHVPRPTEARFSFANLLTRPKGFRKTVDFQVIDLIRLLALLSRNSVPLSVALAWLAPRTGPPLEHRLSEITNDLELGGELGELLEGWATKQPDRLLIELVQKLRLSLDRGTPLADSLESLVESARAEFAANILAKAGSGETKMLIPTVFLILPVTVLFAIYPSLSLLGSAI